MFAKCKLDSISISMCGLSKRRNCGLHIVSIFLQPIASLILHFSEGSSSPLKDQITQRASLLFPQCVVASPVHRDGSRKFFRRTMYRTSLSIVVRRLVKAANQQNYHCIYLKEKLLEASTHSFQGSVWVL